MIRLVPVMIPLFQNLNSWTPSYFLVSLLHDDDLCGWEIAGAMGVKGLVGGKEKDHNDHRKGKY